MDKNTSEVLLKLQETINSWTQEVTQTRSALTESLGATADAVKPAFRLIRPAAPAQEQAEAAANEVQTEPSKDTSQERVDANKALMRSVEELKLHVAEAERRAQETERERARLDTEIEFAREQLHLRNKSAQDAEERRIQYEMQAEGVAQALGGSELEITDLRQQLRSKDWRLLKTRNVLDLPRADHARRLADVGRPPLQVEALRTEAEERQASESKTLSSLAEPRSAVDARTEESKEARDAFAKLQIDLDELMSTNMVLREDIKEFKARLVDREQVLEEVRKELEQAERNRQDLLQKESAAAGRIKALSAALEEKAASLEEGRQRLRDNDSATAERIRELRAALEQKDASFEKARQELLDKESSTERQIEALRLALEEKTQAFEESQRAHDELSEKMSDREQLERALRDEVASLRQQEAGNVHDVEALNKALKEELESMRQVAVQRDFVVHHSEAELASMSRREAETEDSLRQALEASERTLAEAVEASKTQRAVEFELGALRVQSEEKDAAMRELWDELKVLRERVEHVAEMAPPSKEEPTQDSSGIVAAGRFKEQMDNLVISLKKAKAKLKQARGGTEESSREGLGSRLKRIVRLSKPDSKEDSD